MSDDATRRQVAAARPDRSTWLSANAGSGKTRVLTDRVARLLLDGASPQNILCLTYTKAAASEMQNRLFRRLGAWAMAPDAALRAELDALGAGSDLSDRALSRARRLFAEAIETPGGLRIQTIHSFCAVLLRRFPLESGVSPQFTEMDDRVGQLLRGELVELLSETRPDVMAAVALHLTDQGFDTLAAQVAKARDRFSSPVAEADLRAHLGLAVGDDADAVLADVFLPDTEAVIASFRAAVAKAGKKTDIAVADALAGLSPPWAMGDLAALEGAFLTKTPPFNVSARIPTKDVRTEMGDGIEPLAGLMARVEAARERRVALGALDKSRALHAFAQAFLPLYAEAKQARGWLDFDDLILKARDLLTVRDVAEWVLFRLDGGIDHILVDEAQDTSPTQWQVIEALAAEFAAGHGSSAAGDRTIFVVGDVKQSIYSFQGADPAGFMRLHDRFRAALGDKLQRLELSHSFRSSAAILSTVDAVFEGGAGGSEAVRHEAFHAEMPGRVDLWPLMEKTEKVAAPEWEDLRDTRAGEDQVARLARDLARELKRMVDTGEAIPDGQGGTRPMTDGDILILVQRRNTIFHNVIRACKAAGLRVAGADRLKLGEALAVRDVMALLSFLATPADDLSLAAVLRSPLFGLGEGDLFSLAHGRETTLWASLQDRHADHPETFAALSDMRDQSDYLRPFELIERILVRHDGRARLVGRLGVEAEEAIDALLSQALSYESTGIPSLTGFLAWFEAEDVELKRQPDAAGTRLRVMSVHGAKGLEAPVVVLPDTVRADRPEVDHVIWGTEGPPLWRQNAAEQPAAMQEVIEGRNADRKAESERLLYVAMTRAQSWLIVCGTGEAGLAGRSWYGTIADGVGRLDASPIDTPVGAGRRVEPHPWPPAVPPRPEAASVIAADALPAWYDIHAAAPAEPPAPISPSGLGGAKALPGEIAETSEAEVLARGTAIHTLLEHMTPGRPDLWRGEAETHAGAFARSDPAQFEAVLAEAGGVLSAPHLAHLFDAAALTEVDVTAPHPSGRVIFGTIDRLVVAPDRVLAVDFKSNRVVPAAAEAVPGGLLAQMGTYAAALRQVFPDRRVETALLWTVGAVLMPLPDDLVRNAFDAMAHLDG